MPDDSCRTCGGELAKHSRCTECKKIIQKICLACNLKTHKEFHLQCANLDLHQVTSQQTHTQVQNIIYKKPTKINKKHLLQAFIVSGLTLAVLTGVVFTEYLIPISEHSQVISDNKKVLSTEPEYETPTTISSSNSNTDAKPDNLFKAQYVNCLGISDGSSLTINCPTDYGIVYKAIVEIPDDLMLQFESKVFNMRNFSVLENPNHLVIMYQKQTYVTTFVAK